MNHDQSAEESTQHNAPRPNRRLSILVVAMLFLCGVFVGRRAEYVLFPMDKVKPVAEAFRQVEQYAIYDLTEEEAMDGAIQGMLMALNDQHAMYVPPAQSGAFEKELNGRFAGIGAEVNMLGGRVTIASPMEHSPALQAGLWPGDVIYDIDGTSTEGLTLNECVDLLTGVPGTDVRVSIQRGSEPLRELTITRQPIVSSAVLGFERQVGTGAWSHVIDTNRNIAYFDVTQFVDTISDQFAAALLTAEQEAGGPLGGIIIDVRGNPGGDRAEVVEMVSLFVEQGKTVMSEVGRNDTHVSPASGKTISGLQTILRGPDAVPLMVMTDQESASASEILAGALQDLDRAIIIGGRTYGKGTVQTLMPLASKENALIKFTSARFALPSGRFLNKEEDAEMWGVDPDPGFAVLETSEQMRKRILGRRPYSVLYPQGAIEQIKPEGIERHWADTTWIAETVQDDVFADAIDAMRVRIDTGDFVPLVATNASTMPTPRDLWADGAVGIGSVVEVRDIHGELVRTFEVTDGLLEQYFLIAPLLPVDETAP